MLKWNIDKGYIVMVHESGNRKENEVGIVEK